MKSYEQNFKMDVYRLDIDDTVSWVAEYPSISTVVGGGNTPIEAIKQLQENTNFFFECLEADGDPLPVEDDPVKFKACSGKIPLRTSKSLHFKAKELAKKEGISLNLFLNEGISAYVAQKSLINEFKEIYLEK